MNKWRLCVPTYKRKSPLILNMLEKDENLEIYFCCRNEEIETGFYDDLSRLDRVHIVNLGDGLTELGETRQRVLEYCKNEGVQYCCMFDDGISNVVNELTNDSISNVFTSCIDLMENDKLSEYIIGFTFTKRYYLNDISNTWKKRHNTEVKDRNYFLVHAGQAVMINVDKAFEHNISYKNMNICGFEDAAFEGDSIKEGLIWAGRKHIMIDGLVPNCAKPGGSHHDNFNIESKYDKQNKLCYNYLNMMGIHIRKKYEYYCGGYCSFIMWDFDYFYTVLCSQRKQNMKIIHSKFSL